MSNNAYVKLVQASNQQTISIDELKEMFQHYQASTKKTGSQINWNYSEASFPYVIHDLKEGDGNWIYLKSDRPRYNYIVFGIGKEPVKQADSEESIDQTYIQAILPQGATHGDKGKAVEFLKLLGEKLAGEVHLFNSRIMYYYKRK